MRTVIVTLNLGGQFRIEFHNEQGKFDHFTSTSLERLPQWTEKWLVTGYTPSVAF